jgi:hypothetical protein
MRERGGETKQRVEEKEAATNVSKVCQIAVLVRIQLWEDSVGDVSVRSATHTREQLTAS